MNVDLYNLTLRVPHLPSVLLLFTAGFTGLSYGTKNQIAPRLNRETNCCWALTRKRDELAKNNQEAAEFGWWGMCWERIFHSGEVTTAFFVSQRAEFPQLLARVCLLCWGGSNWSWWVLKRATKQTWHWQGWGMLQIPAVLPQRRRGFLDEPPFVLNFPLFRLNKAMILPVLMTTAFWKCKITRSH